MAETFDSITWREGRELSPELSGRVALVTGAGRGFGRAISVLLAQRGADVACCDVLADVDETAEAVRAGAPGRRAIAARVDVMDEDAVKEFVARVESELGPVDILVNNAGGTLGIRRQPIELVSTDDWRRIVEVNLFGAFYFVRAVAGGMKERRSGSIVNISSGAGRSHSRTGVQAYATAKAAVIGFTRQLAVEMGPYGVTVNSVAPGLVLSTKEYQGNWRDRTEEQRRTTVESIALRRLGTVEDIAEAVAFLVSERGRYISGQTIGVDGGHWMF
jgi:3-oxoacyl-[acyl-carrier protein] reductase